MSREGEVDTSKNIGFNMLESRCRTYIGIGGLSGTQKRLAERRKKTRKFGKK